MNELKFTDIELNAAALGEETDYPDLSLKKDVHSGLKGESLPEKIYFGYGAVNNILPYKLRESYDRDKKPRRVKAAILENDRLKAVFLTEYGCRLWSLYDKVEKKELLYHNPVLQFGNLAVRDAWFSGGVEWNIGFIGHTPFTTEKMFCERVTDRDTGNPVLRFYEFERIRGVVYEVDAYLSDEYGQLMIRVRINNCHGREIPMYWWSNIAVPETVDTRIIVDADSAYTHDYVNGLKVVGMPYYENTDISYTCMQQNAADFFFRVPDDRRKFIAALNGEGVGLAQTSTARLRGRKLFRWGMGRGGRKWQSFLSKPALPYLEIQAGLARTQCECIPMPANTVWEWIEAYGIMKADPQAVHGDDWTTAVNDVRERLIPQEYLEAELKRTAASIVGVPGERLQNGSGWGYVEAVRRAECGKSPLCSKITFGRESITEEEKPWLELVENGAFCEPQDPKKSGFMIQKDYIPLLEKAIAQNDNWFARMHLGLCLFGDGEREKAREQLIKSIDLKKNAFALSAVSYIDEADGSVDSAIKYVGEAFALDSGSYGLLKHYMALLNANERFEEILRVYAALSEELRENGRIKYYRISALVGLGRIDEAGELIARPFEIADLREGEVSLYKLWNSYCLKRLKPGEVPEGESAEEYIKKNYIAPAWMYFNMSDK